jgi:hypothetical protein
MDDATGPKPYIDRAMMLEEYRYPIGLMNGSTGTPGTAGWRLAVNLPFPQSVPSHLALPALAGLSSIATTSAARTNPSTAHVALPVAFTELRDLPRLIRDTGRLLTEGHRIILRSSGRSSSNEGASAYLSWQFGWKPLISDLSKLLSFHDVADKRFTELKRLFEKGGLSKTYQYQTDTAQSKSSGLIESGFTLISGVTEITTTRKVWGVTHWKPTPGITPKSDEQLRKYAGALVLGMTNSQIVSDIWEALPWSWLIDWFTDVGDYLQASNNSIAYLSTPVNVMTHTETIKSITPIYPNWIKGPVSFYGGRTTKRRQLSAISPLSASLPALSGRQLSILGALSVLKLGR